MKDSDICNLHTNLTIELHSINNWIKLNKPRFNISMTFFQNRSITNHISPVILDGEILQCIIHIKFLGVVIDNNFN